MCLFVFADSALKDCKEAREAAHTRVTWRAGVLKMCHNENAPPGIFHLLSQPLDMEAEKNKRWYQ